MIFFVEKNERSFCTTKNESSFCTAKASQCKRFSYFCNKKYWRISDISIWKVNEMLTNDIVSFEQLGPDFASSWHCINKSWTVLLYQC